MSGYDAWKTDAPDPCTVSDDCADCHVTLFPEERERGLCVRCYHEVLAARQDAYERERDDAA
jgi:hypothetical protein